MLRLLSRLITLSTADADACTLYLSKSEKLARELQGKLPYDYEPSDGYRGGSLHTVSKNGE